MVESKYFYRQYYKLCKRKNIQPVPEIKEKIRNTLEFHPERVKIAEWLIILECLSISETLVAVSVKSRKAFTDGIAILN